MTDRARPADAAAAGARGPRSAGASSGNAPRPVVRAVAASLSVAIVLAIAYLAYDVALSRGARPARRRPADAGA